MNKPYAVFGEGFSGTFDTIQEAREVLRNNKWQGAIYKVTTEQDGMFDPEIAVGMAQDIAIGWFKRRGYTMRVTRRDGTACVCTRDMRNDRINVWIVDGFVNEVKYVG